MTTFLQDLRYAARSFRKSPGFALVAVATLALGIGANAAIFALVDRVFLKSLPVRNPGEIVLLRSPGPSQGHYWTDTVGGMSFSYPTPPRFERHGSTRPVRSGGRGEDRPRPGTTSFASGARSSRHRWR